MINKNNLKDISKSRKILMREEDFAYLLPCEPLKGMISNFTITFPDSSMISDDYTIMPHGSVTLVLFQRSGNLYSFLFGPTTRPCKVGSLANQCDIIFIIEFQPAGFYPFTKQNQGELTDKILPFSSVDPSLDKAVLNIFTGSFSIDGLLLEIEKVLMLSIQFPYPEELTLAIQAIIQMEGVMTSAEISDHVYYSPRHLNRLFNLYLGMSMKAFSRLVRINKAIKLLNENTHTLAFICEQLGYYDVSHFVKDFKIVCTVTPQEYRTNMSDFYSEIAKF